MDMKIPFNYFGAIRRHETTSSTFGIILAEPSTRTYPFFFCAPLQFSQDRIILPFVHLIVEMLTDDRK